MNKYKELLSKVSLNIKNFSTCTPLSDYNIFYTLQIYSKEVIMCRFLADLLNPEGYHNCGILFLKSFFEEILKENHISDELLQHTDVIKEFVIDNNRRIDIVIKNNCFFLPIEIKIYACEQEGQCYDYYEFAKKYVKNPLIVYLTRFGSIPSEYSRKNRNGTNILSLNNIQCISWSKDIRNWLIKISSQLNEPIKSITMQYIDIINVIANERNTKIMEKNIEILYESQDYFNAGIAIEKHMKTAKAKLMRFVFNDFKEEMKKLENKYGLELEKKFNYFTYEDQCNDKFYDKNHTTYPGLNYIIKKAKFNPDNIQMWFRIEVTEQLYAGITLFDTNAESNNGTLKGWEVNEITEQMVEQASKYLNRDIITPVNWWVTCCYSNGKRQDIYYDDVPDFKNMNSCAISLVNNNYRKQFVETAVNTFEEHILKYLKDM